MADQKMDYITIVIGSCVTLLVHNKKVNCFVVSTTRPPNYILVECNSEVWLSRLTALLKNTCSDDHERCIAFDIEGLEETYSFVGKQERT